VTGDRMLRDGPPRMEGWSTWSGRERSSHSRFPPVPRVRLVTFLFLLFPKRFLVAPSRCDMLVAFARLRAASRRFGLFAASPTIFFY
jgi:hypothetical protein